MTMGGRRRRRRNWKRPAIVVLAVVGLCSIGWAVLRDGSPGELPELASVSEAPIERPAYLANTDPDGDAGPRTRELLSNPPTQTRQRTPEPVVISQSTTPLVLPGTTGRDEQRSEPPAEQRTLASPEPTRESRPDPRAAEQTGSRSPMAGAISAEAERELERAERLVRENRLVEARRTLSDALRRADGRPADGAKIRARLGSLNDELVFSPRVHPGDPVTANYSVRSGDVLSRIVQRESLAVDWRLITRVNRIDSPQKIRVGQSLKLVKGPFHAVVHKGDYRMDLWWGDADRPGSWLFIRSFDVGLGEENSTPVGEFRVMKGSKVIDPGWTNPRTFETYKPKDPSNPIGRYWIGIEGVGDASVHTSYGLHGTIEPDSIGRSMSMGCVRMHDDDIELMYELLSEGRSLVRIVP